MNIWIVSSKESLGVNDPISFAKKYSQGDILKLFIETKLFLKENYQRLQKNRASDLKTSSSSSNDAIIAPLK